MTYQAAPIRRGDRVIIADVVEKARVDELVAKLRKALDIPGRQGMHEAVETLIDTFEKGTT
jgi:HEAT repeat protein